MTRTFWLSFANKDGFLGVAVVDVDVVEAASMKEDLDRRFPQHKPGSEWLAAATREAWRSGCNPGGQVLAQEIPLESDVPRNRLLTGEELLEFAGRAVH